LALKWNPDNILIRSLGAVALAAINAVVNNRVGQVTSFLRNGDMADWLVILGDLVDVLPDGTTLGEALDAATDAAIYDLSHSLFVNRVVPFPSLATAFTTTAAPAPAPTPAQTPAGAAATGAPSPSATLPAASVPTPIPAASMSAAGTVATAGY
jgi:hypothetical protein